MTDKALLGIEHMRQLIERDAFDDLLLARPAFLRHTWRPRSKRAMHERLIADVVLIIRIDDVQTGVIVVLHRRAEFGPVVGSKKREHRAHRGAALYRLRIVEHVCFAGPGVLRQRVEHDAVPRPQHFLHDVRSVLHANTFQSARERFRFTRENETCSVRGKMFEKHGLRSRSQSRCAPRDVAIEANEQTGTARHSHTARVDGTGAQMEFVKEGRRAQGQLRIALEKWLAGLRARSADRPSVAHLGPVGWRALQEETGHARTLLQPLIGLGVFGHFTFRDDGRRIFHRHVKLLLRGGLTPLGDQLLEAVIL